MKFSAKRNQPKKIHVGIYVTENEKSHIENLCTQLQISQCKLVKNALNKTYDLDVR
jgi:hypothetical protein